MKDINLLVEDNDSSEKNSRINKATLFKIFIGFAIYACILAVTIVVPKIMIKTYESNIESMKKSMDSAEYLEMKQVKNLIANEESVINQKSAVINSIQKKNYSVREILNTLINSVPEGVKISNISYDSNLLNIELHVEDAIAASEFLVNVGRIDFLNPNNSAEMIVIPSTKKSFDLRYSFTIIGKDVL